MSACPLSSHPETAKAAVHPPPGSQLPHAGAAAHRVAGERTLRVLCGGFAKKETQQKLVLARGHLPVPQGKRPPLLLSAKINQRPFTSFPL